LGGIKKYIHIPHPHGLDKSAFKENARSIGRAGSSVAAAAVVVSQS
jgi:hypothetical protein